VRGAALPAEAPLGATNKRARMKLVNEIDKGGAVMVCKYCGGEVQEEQSADIWRVKVTAYVCQACRGVQ